MQNFDYLYDKSFFSDVCQVEHFVKKQLSYKSYDNAYIMPANGLNSGIYTSDKQFIDASSIHNGLANPLPENEVSASYFSDETVVYIGFLYEIWGHVLTDDIKRFWFLKTDILLKEFEECKLVYIQPFDGTISDNTIEFFEMLGIDFSQFVRIKENTQYKRVIVPDECFFCDDSEIRYFTTEYRQLIQIVRSFSRNYFVKDDTCEKLYFSHAKYGCYTIGEEKLEDFFRGQGYRIVYPEDYTFKEQLNMLANCHDFASTVGSCSHNMIFLPEHANVYLIPRAHYLENYQLALDSLVDLNVIYIDSSLSVLAKRKFPSQGPFFFYVSENLLRAFDADTVCDEKYYRRQLRDFKEYVRCAKMYNDLADRYQPEYYTRQLAYCMEKYHNSNRILVLFAKIRQYGLKTSLKVFFNIIWSKCRRTL